MQESDSDDDKDDSSYDSDESEAHNVENGTFATRYFSNPQQKSEYKSHKGDEFDDIPSEETLDSHGYDADPFDRWNKLMAGSTTGRKIKRVILKYGSVHTALGISLICLSSYVTVQFQFISCFNTNTHGASIIVSSAQLHFDTSLSLSSEVYLCFFLSRLPFHPLRYKSLLWMVSMPTFFAGIFSVLAVYNWASLCTNSDLFLGLLRIYIGALFYLLTTSIWCFVALLLTFEKKVWKSDLEIMAAFPSYVASLLLLAPFIISLILHLLDVFFLKDELINRGVLAEPDAPKGTKDLKGLSLISMSGYICSIPFQLYFQLADLCGALLRLFQRFMLSRRNRSLVPKGEEQMKKRKETEMCYKIVKTLKRIIVSCCFCFLVMGKRIGSRVPRGRRKVSQIGPDSVSGDKKAEAAVRRQEREKEKEEKKIQGEEVKNLKRLKEIEDIKIAREKSIADNELKDLTKRQVDDEEKNKIRMSEKKKEEDRKKEEREENELKKKDLEIEEKRQEAEVESNRIRRKKQEEEDFEAEVAAEKQRRKDKREADAAALAENANSKTQSPDYPIQMPFYPILTVPLYRSLWAPLGVSGSFECALRVPTTVTLLVTHLKKQGFHVVYTSTGTEPESGEEIEIGFCNIRENQNVDGGLFMARFSISKKLFTSTMKSEKPSDVPKFVKKFALAKVLKIDLNP